MKSKWMIGCKALLVALFVVMGSVAMAEGVNMNKIIKFEASASGTLKVGIGSENMGNVPVKVNVGRKTVQEVMLNNKVMSVSCEVRGGQEVTIYGEVTSLDCSDCNLEKLDVSENNLLMALNCSGNRLEKLDVSKNIALVELDCSDNNIKKLDVSKNVSLEVLKCGHTQLEKLDVASCGGLSVLDCNVAKLAKLNVTKNRALVELNCGGNLLKEVNVSKNEALRFLICSHNQMEALNVTNNVVLMELECDHNVLTSLNLSKNAMLWSVSCGNNSLNAEEYNKIYEALPNRKDCTRKGIIMVGDEDMKLVESTDGTQLSSKNWWLQILK